MGVALQKEAAHLPGIVGVRPWIKTVLASPDKNQIVLSAQFLALLFGEHGVDALTSL